MRALRGRAPGRAEPQPSDLGVEVRRARRWLLLALLGVALAVGIVLLVEKAAGYRGLLAQLREAQPEWLLLAVAAEACSFAGYIWTLRAVVRFEHGPDLELAKGTRLVFASLGAGRVFAGGGMAGIFVDFWALTKAGLSRDEAAVRVLAFKTLLFCLFGAAAWLSALTLVAGASGGARLQLTLPWLIAVPAVFLALAGLRAPARRKGLPGEPGRLPARILTATRAATAIVTALATRPSRSGAATLAAGLAYWAGDAACLWAGLRAFGTVIPPATLGLAYATGYLATLLPLPFGGVGGVEAAMTLALGGVGVPLDAALLGVLAYRAVSFWLPTLPGLAALSTLDRLGRQLERLDGGEPG